VPYAEVRHHVSQGDPDVWMCVQSEEILDVALRR